MNNPKIIAYVCVAGICILTGIFLGSFYNFADFVSDPGIDPPEETIYPAKQPSMVSPSDLVPSVDGSFIISDQDGKSLYKISVDGSVEWVVNEKAAKPYGFWHISGIGTDLKGNVYVSDQVTSHIYRFSKNGVLLGTWGGFGTGQGQFNNPGGITVLSQGKADDQIVICDTGNDRVQVFNSSGSYIRGFSVQDVVNSPVVKIPPELRNKTTDTQDVYIQSVTGANPRYVERTFNVLSSNKEIPLSLQIDRSHYLGAQKISRNRYDIASKNPEDWGPVLIREIADPTTRDTIQSTHKILLNEANTRRFNEREKIEFIVHFVQRIPLTDESDNRYPIEILHDKKGNSFDKALLLYCLLFQDGYDVVFLAYPGFSHAGVGIKLKNHISSDIVRTYKDDNGDEYLYINPDGLSFFGGLASKYRSCDPFMIHLLRSEKTLDSFDGYTYSMYVVESIVRLYEKYQFLLNKEKELRGDEAKKVRFNYEKIKQVLDYVEKNPSNIEGAYMRIKNSKVNDIVV
ncbi:MAG: hypothetical protein GXY48_01530 [Methanomicrobiales archaeon]|nr:hypothetical protein [Methanomicrobiales archaeon]